MEMKKQSLWTRHKLEKEKLKCTWRDRIKIATEALLGANIRIELREIREKHIQIESSLVHFMGYLDEMDLKISPTEHGAMVGGKLINLSDEESCLRSAGHSLGTVIRSIEDLDKKIGKKEKQSETNTVLESLQRAKKEEEVRDLLNSSEVSCLVHRVKLLDNRFKKYRKESGLRITDLEKKGVLPVVKYNSRNPRIS